jgi:hypothetical protein
VYMRDATMVDYRWHYQNLPIQIVWATRVPASAVRGPSVPWMSDYYGRMVLGLPNRMETRDSGGQSVDGQMVTEKQQIDWNLRKR